MLRVYIQSACVTVEPENLPADACHWPLVPFQLFEVDAGQPVSTLATRDRDGSFSRIKLERQCHSPQVL